MTRLWWINPATVPSNPERLTPDERAQYARFIPNRKRHEYLVTRLLVRHVLGDVQLVTNEWGRPELPLTPGGERRTRFNISHTDGLILLLESDEHEVGVDTELVSRAPTLLRLAPSVFAPRELAELDALPERDRPLRAVTLWTLKESYIKARGMGLALALQDFAFHFDADGVTRVDVEPRLDDTGARWQFRTFALGPHLVSTALSAPAAQQVEVERVEAKWGA